MNDTFSFDYDTPAEPAGSGNLLSQLPVIAWQRKWWIIVPAIIGIIAAIAAIFVISPVYRSNAVMLVESSQLPDEVLVLDGTELIDRRIARIRQQITARPDLISLIERHGLYVDERRSDSLASVVEDMREAITITTNEAAGGGRSDGTAIAFELAFSYSQPVPAQAVTQDLMNRILQLAASGNVEQATNTVQFLSDQAGGLESQISELQGQISQVTAANSAALIGGPVMGGNTGSYDAQIAGLQRENQQLLSQRSIALSSDQRDPVVVAAEQRLAGARAVYAENHPDVVIAEQLLAEARQLAKSNTSRLPIEAIDQQIAFNNSQIASLRTAKAQDEAQMRSRLANQARAPLVQQRIGELQQRLSALNQQYEQVQIRLMAARAGVRAEDEQMSERLVVVEPPVVPEEPVWPDRLLLALAGIAGGLGIGLALAFAIELLLQPIRDPQALRAIPGANSLGLVPVIDAKKRPSKRRRWHWPFARRASA